MTTRSSLPGTAHHRPRGAARFLLPGLFASCLLACGPSASSDDAPAPDLAETKQAAVATYADVAHATYEDAWLTAMALQNAVDSFLTSPGPAGLARCRQAWLTAREPYGRSEAFRFGNGPIDDADGPEGLLNAWPMDEAYVDRVAGAPNAGIINAPEAYPVIDRALIEQLNEQGGETNVSAGYHAIEFLLWGQDLDPDGPGDRPWQDYTTAPNAARRGQYLRMCTDLLVHHLHQLVEAWAPDVADNHRARFVGGDPDVALGAILQGIGTLAKGELAGERLEVALLTQDQEDEHSCFSDNTDADIRMNIQGIENVFLGRCVRIDGRVVQGTGIDRVIAAVDPKAARELLDDLENCKALGSAIPHPFDQQVQNGDPGGAVAATVATLRRTADHLSAAADALGLRITTHVD